MPRSEAGLTCRTCYAKSKDPNSGGGSTSSHVDEPTDFAIGASAHDDRSDIPDFEDIERGSSEPMPHDGLESLGATAPAEKPRTEGNWKCATCGGAITSLPFTPRDVTNLKCLDCFKRSKA
jgi:hypothetical protein